MITANEEWRNVVGAEHDYMVSSKGRVKSKYRLTKKGICPSKILKIWCNDGKYPRVNLQINGKSKSCSVHRLVADAFLPNPLNKPQVNHKNGIKTDNNVDNLEWATRHENMQHAYDNGLLEACKILKGHKTNHPLKKLSDPMVLMIYTLAKNGFASKEIAEVFNVHPSYVPYLLKNLTGKELDVAK